MTNFLRLGSRLINVASICDIELEDSRLEHPAPFPDGHGFYRTHGPIWRRPCVTITLGVTEGDADGRAARTFTLYDDDAEAVRELFLHKSWLATLGATVVDVVHLYCLEQFKKEYGR